MSLQTRQVIESSVSDVWRCHFYNLFYQIKSRLSLSWLATNVPRKGYKRWNH